MHCQALDQGEILSIRWAHDDPNPVAKDSIERADKDAMVALLQAKGISLTPASYDYPMDYQLPQAKRLKVEDGGDGILSQHPELAYPDTDAQYNQYANSAATASSSSAITSDIDNALAAKKNALERLGLLYDDSDEKKAESEPAAESEAAEEETNEEEAEENDEEGEGGWQPYVDESTGATYYFNLATGESSWTKPAELEASESATTHWTVLLFLDERV